jgi:hypothetical protein
MKRLVQSLATLDKNIILIAREKNEDRQDAKGVKISYALPAVRESVLTTTTSYLDYI